MQSPSHVKLTCTCRGRAGRRRASCALERIGNVCCQARARVQKSTTGQVGEMPLPPRLNKAFARVPVQARRAAALRHSPWSNKVMAWKRIGKPRRKVQPLIFKRGMLQFDSLLWARNFHVLVPHTPMGFSLPAEAFLGSSVLLSLRLPVRPVPSRVGLPSKSAPAPEGARKGRGLAMGSPSSPSESILVAAQGLPSPGAEPPSLS